jgi:ATP-dependent exoDNAse (exonuclease V) alpha subunit
MMEKKAPAVMELRVGAQVMLLKNTPEWNLVNGSRGVVVDFDRSNFPIVLFTNGATHTIEQFEVFQAAAGGAMTRKQLPLKLACM